MNLLQTKTQKLIAYSILLICSSLPLTCPYLLSTGDTAYWMQHLTSGAWIVPIHHLLLFSATTLSMIVMMRFASLLTGNAFATYFCTSLYLLCPIRLYLWYDAGMLRESIYYLLLPFLALGILLVVTPRRRLIGVLLILASSFIWALVSHLDSPCGLTYRFSLLTRFQHPGFGCYLTLIYLLWRKLLKKPLLPQTLNDPVDVKVFFEDVVLPCIILLITFLYAIFQCNTLTYQTLPL